MKRIHLVGIGGIGMSALARYYRVHGHAVSGSDSVRSVITDQLRAEGIRVKVRHSARHIKKSLNLVVYNRAIRPDNPELIAARKLGIPTLPYAKALGEIVDAHTTIAITGSHGKSTTTALAGLLLARAGLDPTVLVGTNLKEFDDKNFRRGHIPSNGRNGNPAKDYLVLEADDYGGAFLEYSPAVAIVTNIDNEHMDFYKSLRGVKNAFVKFMSQVKPGGTLIVNRNDKILRSHARRIEKDATARGVTVRWYSTRGRAGKASRRVKDILKLPGEHNLSNAMAIYELAHILKIHEKTALAAIGAYHGAWRRMEFRKKKKMGDVPVSVYDDYAHHPTEIRATLAGFKEKFPHSPLICVFEPHQAERLRLLFKDFMKAFAAADVLILIPSYRVEGRDEKPTKFTSEFLATSIQRKYSRKVAYYLKNPRKLNEFLIKVFTEHPEFAKHSPVLVMMGAGTIVQFTDHLVK